MPDPFLLAHQVAESVFDIGGKLYPVSVRDQMVRGQSIIDRAVAAGFASTRRELLVIGAGAAGVTAALRAVSYGIRTHLIEFGPRPFGRQATCSTRWIDPHEYEWPSGQWVNDTYPYNDPPLHPYYGHPTPLPWGGQWADSLAAGWTARFNAARAAAGHLLVYYPSTTLSPVSPPAFTAGTRTWQVHLSGVAAPITVGMIINAVGFGVERCEVPRTAPVMYRGLAFWETDPFRRPNCGLARPKVAKVLISGGGDGALQDFLRVVTRKASARRLYRAMRAAMPSSTKSERLRRNYLFGELEQRVSGAENRGSRSYLWGTSGGHDHDVHRLLHAAHADAVNWALSNAGVQTALKAVLRKTAPDVKLVHPCVHFTQSYPLNRFLALLVDAFLAARDGSPSRLIPGAEVVSVVGGGGHVCNPAMPHACLGESHTITLGPSFHANCAAALLPLPSSLQANVVIIRHGVTGLGPAGPGPWKTLAHIGHPRQLLPLHPSRS